MPLGWAASQDWHARRLGESILCEFSSSKISPFDQSGSSQHVPCMRHHEADYTQLVVKHPGQLGLHIITRNFKGV